MPSVLSLIPFCTMPSVLSLTPFCTMPSVLSLIPFCTMLPVLSLPVTGSFFVHCRQSCLLLYQVSYLYNVNSLVSSYNRSVSFLVSCSAYKFLYLFTAVKCSSSTFLLLLFFVFFPSPFCNGAVLVISVMGTVDILVSSCNTVSLTKLLARA